MPPEKEAGPHAKGPTNVEGSPTHTDATESSGAGRHCVSSAQVNWLTVRRFVLPVLNQVNDWPMLGTPAWCTLAHDDPAKWAALLDGAQHWALRVDSCQEARAEVSRDISGATDWPAIADEIRQRRGVYIPRRRP